MKNPRILYFSLNPKSVEAFYKYNEEKRAGELLSFRLYPQNDVNKFKHTSNLVSFLEENNRNSSLLKIVIIDYVSLCSLKSKDKEDSIFRSRELILRTILNYPEIYFLFDETRDSYVKEFSFVDFLFLHKYENKALSLLRKYHTFKAEKDVKKTYEVITHGRDNLFDGTNLRFFSRQYIHDVLKVNRYNFSLRQKSRKDSLAICVEEEHSQNRFNSYALYANGFRVLPVVTASELKYINSGKDKEIKPDLIIRDFDLQFPDAEGARIDFVINKNIFKINEVDYIRGVKFWDSKDYKDDSCPSGYLDKWQIFIANQGKEGEDDTNQGEERSHYWENLQNIPTFFISKGVKNIELCRTESELLGKVENGIIGNIFQDKKDIQYLRGLRKPVSGIYCPLRYCEIIKERYKSFDLRNKSRFVMREASLIVDDFKNNSNIANGGENREKVKRQTMKYLVYKYQIKKNNWLYWRLWFYLKIKRFSDCSDTDFDKLFWKDDLKKQAWVIDTSRENHDHGVPLDVYDLVQSMLARAKHFYSIGKYIRAAVISSETIELLNGFHESLMLRAYYYLAISENAIAMNTTGGSEIELIEDTNFRINKIKKEIDRILERPQNEGLSFYERRELKFNILNQIYSECRKYCREKEYFGPENCYISAIAHVNEGFSPLDIRYELGSIWNRIRLIAEKFN